MHRSPPPKKGQSSPLLGGRDSDTDRRRHVDKRLTGKQEATVRAVSQRGEGGPRGEVASGPSVRGETASADVPPTLGDALSEGLTEVARRGARPEGGFEGGLY